MLFVQLRARVVSSFAPITLACGEEAIDEALEQAIGDAGQKVPVVVHRQNRKPWVVIARLDDLPRLAVQIYLTLAENA